MEGRSLFSHCFKIAAATLLALAPLLPATAATLQCEGCNFDQMYSMAVAHADATRTYTTPSYVVNVTGNQVIKFSFFRERDLIPGQYVTIAVDQSAEPAISAFVNQLYQIKASGEAEVSNFWADNLPGSVYEDITNPTKHANLQAWLIGTKSDLTQRFIVFLQGLNPFPGFNPASFSLTLTIHYVDGSKSVYRYDPASKTWDRTKGTERDSHGNIVPVTLSDFTSDGGGERQFNFEGGSDGDMINFLARASRFGINITGTFAQRRFVCVTISGVTSCRTVVIF